MLALQIYKQSISMLRPDVVGDNTHRTTDHRAKETRERHGALGESIGKSNNMGRRHGILEDGLAGVVEVEGLDSQ